jgi:hypothetical protein
MVHQLSEGLFVDFPLFRERSNHGSENALVHIPSPFYRA